MARLSPLALFAHSVAHTQPAQLWHRLVLSLKRRTMAATRGAGIGLGVEAPIVARPGLPRPLYPARSHLLVGDGSAVNLVGSPHDLQIPMDWRPSAHDYGTRLGLLSLHSMEYLEALDDGRFLGLVNDWIEQNRPFQRQYWLWNWSAFALSIRVVVWLQQFAARGIDLELPQNARIRDSLLRQLRFLETNLERDICGNHLIRNVKALLWGAACFGGAHASRWRRLGSQLLARELGLQILPDGMHHELSPAYHAQVFGDLLECFSVLEEGPLKATLKHKLELMAQCLADFTHPDGLVSLFNDGGLHMAHEPRVLLAAYRELSGRLVESDGFFDYSTSGYFGLREGGNLLLVDCAPLAPDHLPAHGHGDALSFELSLGGKRIFIDPGVHEYNEGELRAISRSTRAHNTLTLDDEDQSEFWKSFRVGRRARILSREVRFKDGKVWACAAHDGYRRLAKGAVHQRTFTGNCRSLKVSDEVTGGAGQSVVARLLLHPECTVERVGRKRVRCRSQDVVVEVTATAPIEINDFVCFMDFGQTRPTKQLAMSYGLAPVSGGFEIRRTEQP